MPVDALLPAISSPAFEHVRRALDLLGNSPPQTLLLEGGTELQRQDAARYWAARLNCPQAPAGGSPCLACPTCAQVAAGEHLNLAAYDGRISNREDETSPGLVRALTADNVRELKKTLRDKTRDQGHRIVLLSGLEHVLRGSAANALLKALEEPSPFSAFVLLAVQREQILPTLVSRSFCLTLPWPDSRNIPPDMQPWLDALARFLRNEKSEEASFLERTAAKGALDQTSAPALLLCCQKILAQVLAGEQAASPLAGIFARMDAEKCSIFSRWLFEAQQALTAGITPARVVEALAMRLFVLLRRKG